MTSGVHIIPIGSQTKAASFLGDTTTNSSTVAMSQDAPQHHVARV